MQRRRGVKKLLHVALGIVTSFGGFLEAGSITTSIQAGAEYVEKAIAAGPAFESDGVSVVGKHDRIGTAIDHRVQEIKR